MKKILLYLVFALVIPIISCSEENLDKNSVIKEPNSTQNAFDVWLYHNYTVPYNIDFKYKLEDIELSTDYVVVPAEYTKSVVMAKLVKHLCTDAYSEVAGEKFVRLYFPKIFQLVGSASWIDESTMRLGEAEGGRKITLLLVNELDHTDIPALNYYYFHTIHHEFSHILHQTVSYPVAFKDITGTDYLTDNWSNFSVLDQDVWLPRGFISAYSRKDPDEDFVELISHYLVYDQEWWDDILAEADETADGNSKTGKEILEEKLVLIKNYLLEIWNIDLDVLKATIQRRQGEINNLNLYDL
jgi:substrate import-associated zinc metallohydrolase lipoprotein